MHVFRVHAVRVITLDVSLVPVPFGHDLAVAVVVEQSERAFDVFRGLLAAVHPAARAEHRAERARLRASRHTRVPGFGRVVLAQACNGFTPRIHDPALHRADQKRLHGLRVRPQAVGLPAYRLVDAITGKRVGQVVLPRVGHRFATDAHIPFIGGLRREVAVFDDQLRHVVEQHVTLPFRAELLQRLPQFRQIAACQFHRPSLAGLQLFQLPVVRHPYCLRSRGSQARCGSRPCACRPTGV